MTKEKNEKNENGKKEENSFVFYRSFYDVVNLIPDAAMRCRAYTAICEYGFHGVEPAEDEDVLVKMVFTQAKPQIDANNKRRENGKKGGAPRRTNAEPKDNQTVTKSEPLVNQSETKAQPNDNDNDNANVNANANANVNGNENGNGSKRKTQTAVPFTPPTPDEVQAYIDERSLDADAERFVDYYTSNGWMIGRNKMKDWKAALRHWSRGDDRNMAKGRDYDYNPRTKGGTDDGNREELRKPQFGLCL